VVGAPTESHDTDGQPGAEFITGAAYIFEKDQGGSNTWGAVKKIVASDGSARAEFGNASPSVLTPSWWVFFYQS
jgi:ribosomal protein L35AE/L33A